MLCGEFPFGRPDVRYCKRFKMHGKGESIFGALSDPKDAGLVRLLDLMLKIDQNQRPTMQWVSDHAWMQRATGVTGGISASEGPSTSISSESDSSRGTVATQSDSSRGTVATQPPAGGEDWEGKAACKVAPGRASPDVDRPSCGIM